MELRVEGEVRAPRVFRFEDLAALPGQVDVAALVAGREGGAVRLRALIEAAGPTAAARFVSLCSADGAFRISAPLDAALEAAIVVYRLGDGPLPAAKGGPARILLVGDVPCRAAAEDEIDACAAVKGLGTIRLTALREAEIGHHHD